ncbi:MAG: sporulation integral membrane protein YlbJ [Bacillota bacterium]
MKSFKTLIWPLLALGMLTVIVLYPKDIFAASLRGLNAWWTVVLPALLPFFILSEILTGFGVVDFLGVLLEPLMRPLFRVPGRAAFIMAVGYTSGAPIGAALTAKMRLEGLCTKSEGERILSFTNNASPLFMLVAVAVGMLEDPSLGVVIAGSHYLANLTLGVALGRLARRQDGQCSPKPAGHRLLSCAFQAMVLAQAANHRPIGHLLTEAIKKSLQTLFLIGGYIILFSVIIQACILTGILAVIAWFLSPALKLLGFPRQLVTATAGGLVEMTMGAKMVAEATAPLNLKVLAVSLILGWSGLSVHGQVASMIAGTDLGMKTFVKTRIAHGLLAAALSQVLLGTHAQPVVLALSSKVSLPASSSLPVWTSALAGIQLMGLSLALLLSLGLAGWLIIKVLARCCGNK